MGGQLCQEQADNRPQSRKLTIWGDYINADTRAILAVLKLAEQDFEFKPINSLEGEHKTNKEFAIISPSLDIPVITEASYKIISGPVQYMTYLTHTRAAVKKKLYPDDWSRQISRHINWFQNKMRPTTGRLMKLLIAQIQRSVNDPNSAPANMQDDIDYEISVIEKMLENLEVELRDQKYFGGELSVIDCLYYTEISTISCLVGRSIVPENTNIENWYSKSM